MSRKANLNRLYEFLEGDKKSLLVTGWDDEEKLKIVIRVLNQYYRQGIIYCASLSSIADLINRDLAKGTLPRTVNSKDMYQMGNMQVRFRKYTDSNRAHGNNQKGFSLYYPVQSILQLGKEQQLIKKIKTDTAKKIIILTTNDQIINKKNEGISGLEILNIVDEIFNLDNSKSNPKLYENVRNNLEKKEF